MLETKKCSNCNEIRSVNEFFKSKQSKDGLKSECKNCAKVKRTLYRRKKGEKESPHARIVDNKKECLICKEFKPFEYFKTNSGKNTNARCFSCYNKILEDKRRVKGHKPKVKPIILEDKRVCLDCGELKDLTCFPKSKWTKVKTSPTCRQCVNIKNKGIRRQAGINAKFEPIITDTGKQCCHCLQIKNFEEFTKTKSGRMGVNSKCKFCVNIITNERRKNDPNFKEKCRAYRKTPSGWIAHKKSEHKRRAIKLKVDYEELTTEFLTELYNTENCYFCGEYTERDRRTMEHKIAITKGGPHTMSNLEMACLTCNCSKNDKSEEEFKLYREKYKETEQRLKNATV
jgi:hypothetical protein